MQMRTTGRGRLKRVARGLAESLFEPWLALLNEGLDRHRDASSKRRQQHLVSRLQSCGVGLRFNGMVTISEPASTVIGNNVHLGDGAFLVTDGGLTIGDNTHISRNLTLYTVNHRYAGDALPYDAHEDPKAVLIGRNVWIGMNVSILPGVSIGDGAVIGMGAVVSADVQPLAVVGGAPAVIVKHRDAAHYRSLEQRRRFGGVNGEPLSAQSVDEFLDGGEAVDGRNFFVVTTGRSGSSALGHALAGQPAVTCLHEPRRQLIRLSSEFAHGSKSASEVERELAAIYLNSSVYPAGVYGEVDQKLWNLIPFLDRLFPRSRFIWLIRDGRDAVTSMCNRGWFSDTEQRLGRHGGQDIGTRWMLYRLNGHKCGEFSESEWSTMSQFEKACWYWAYVNERIERDLGGLTSVRKTVVALEDVERQMPALHEFLGLPRGPAGVPRRNAGADWTDYYRQRGLLGELDRVHWNADQREVFARWCGKTMDRYYGGWDGVAR